MPPFLMTKRAKTPCPDQNPLFDLQRFYYIISNAKIRKNIPNNIGIYLAPAVAL